MPNDQPRYVSYLLRLWQVKGKDRWNWQASLESPATGKRQGFPNLDQLFAFIQVQTQQPTKVDETTDNRNSNDGEQKQHEGDLG